VWFFWPTVVGLLTVAVFLQYSVASVCLPSVTYVIIVLWLNGAPSHRRSQLWAHAPASPRSQLLCCLWLAGTLSGWL